MSPIVDVNPEVTDVVVFIIETLMLGLLQMVDFLQNRSTMLSTNTGRELVGRSRRAQPHPRVQRQGFATVLTPVSTRGEMGHIVLTVLGMVAQMERRFIKEPQRSISKPRLKGDTRGGKRRLDRAEIERLRDEGIGPSETAARIGCSRMQVYRVLAEAVSPRASH